MKLYLIGGALLALVLGAVGVFAYHEHAVSAAYADGKAAGIASEVARVTAESLKATTAAIDRIAAEQRAVDVAVAAELDAARASNESLQAQLDERRRDYRSVAHADPLPADVRLSAERVRAINDARRAAAARLGSRVR